MVAAVDNNKSAAYARLKSIEKINQERVNLIGLKSQSAVSKKVVAHANQPMDAFDVELKVNNEFGVPSLDSVDNLRSIGSASMNKGVVSSSNNHTNNNSNILNLNQSSPLISNNQYLLQHQKYAR